VDAYEYRLLSIASGAVRRGPTDRRANSGSVRRVRGRGANSGVARRMRANVRGASARRLAMDDGPILESLIAGKPWAGWGPPGSEHLTDAVTGLLAAHLRRPVPEVAALLLEDEDHSRYLLLQLLSNTGHAAVYLAIDRVLARRVVVKIHSNTGQHAAQRAVFESQVMARLSHPNVAEIHDMGEQPRIAIIRDESNEDIAVRLAWVYSVIELCDADLETWCQTSEGSREWTEILDRLLEAARGLAFLHERGYVHGDIKPTNILIKDEIAKLSDFGFTAKRGARPLDRPGTPGFTAPEVLEHGPGFAGDVFAFAVTTWLCLFNEYPYPFPANASRQEAYIAVDVRAQGHQIKPPETTPRGLPMSFVWVLEQALHPRPEHRARLDEVMTAMAAARDQHERRQRRRRWVPAITAGTAAVLAVGFSAGALSRARGVGTGVGIVEAALWATDPLVRAELAINAGDIDTAIGVIYQSYDQIENLSTEEIVALADDAKRIAQKLESMGKTEDAIEVWHFVIRLYKRAGQWHLVEEARKAKTSLR
jgi:hypothetical protein